MTNESSYAEALENLATAALFREDEAGLGRLMILLKF